MKTLIRNVRPVMLVLFLVFLVAAFSGCEQSIVSCTKKLLATDPDAGGELSDERKHELQNCLMKECVQTHLGGNCAIYELSGISINPSSTGPNQEFGYLYTQTATCKWWPNWYNV